MKENKNGNFALGEMIVGLIGNFIKKIETEIVQDVKQKAREISSQIKRKTTAIFLIFFGSIFFLVGASLLLENMVPIRGLGYFLIGIIIFLVGLFINIKK